MKQQLHWRQTEDRNSGSLQEGQRGWRRWAPKAGWCRSCRNRHRVRRRWRHQAKGGQDLVHAFAKERVVHAVHVPIVVPITRRSAAAAMEMTIEGLGIRLANPDVWSVVDCRADNVHLLANSFLATLLLVDKTLGELKAFRFELCFHSGLALG